MPQPKTFRDLGVHAELTTALDEQGITHPFAIQELTLPMALGRSDIIGQARTGTGKTLAFGLPLAQHVDPQLEQTQALVIVPTRELCLQVTEDLAIGQRLGVSVLAVYGGVGYDEQNKALGDGVNVVVGTPGRLLDQLGRGTLDLSQVSTLVIDEADEMLDMGFLPDVERLIEACPTERHTMLFSATMPTAVVKLARRYMHHPTFMRADVEEHEVAPTVEQYFFLVHRMDKPRVLARVLQSAERGSCYVFVRTKHMADRLVSELDELGVAAIAVHGDLRQQTRERNMERFRDGSVDVLVATEVAARGLDVGNVSHVVNYDCPEDEKMYLHRIGRTARAGNKGVAVTFAQFNEVDRLNVIRKAVAATDRAVEEIFSTSDRLAELFDLPEHTPWEHLSRSNGRSAGKPAKARGRSDGKPKSSRSSAGRGERARSPRSRDRATSATGRDRDSSATSRERGQTSRRSESDTGETSHEKAPTGSNRTRSRTRTRQRSEPTVQPSSSDRTSASTSKSEGNTRQRSRASSANQPDERGQRSSREQGGARRRARGERTANPDKRTRGGKGTSGGQGNSKDSRQRTSRGNASTRARSDESRPDTPPVPTAAPGEQARGDGQPQPTRRVKVEHLP